MGTVYGVMGTVYAIIYMTPKFACLIVEPDPLVVLSRRRDLSRLRL